MASRHAGDEVPAEPPDVTAESRPGAASCPNGSGTRPQPRRSRALSADYTYELASLTRQAEANLSMLELKAKICTQPLAPLDQVSSPMKSSIKSVINPGPLPPVQRHKGLADQLRQALNDSNIQTPQPNSTDHPKNAVIVHESIPVSNPFSVLDDAVEMESDACSRKRQPSEDSNASNRSSRSRDRHASPKRVRTLESRVQRNTLPLVNQGFVAPQSVTVPPPTQSSLSTIHLAPDQQKDFPLVPQDDDVALSNEMSSSPRSKSASEMNPSAMESSGEEAEFKKASHRADRKLGIPIVIRATGGGDFRKANPITLHSGIVKAAGVLPSRLKMNSTGSISIDVLSDAAASRLLTTTAICGIPVESHLPAAYRANSALITGIPASYSDEALLSYLQDQGVTLVRRRFRRNGTNTQIPTDEVVLHFQENAERPDSVDLGFWRSKVRDYTEPPPRCFRCQRFGHVAKHCHSNQARCSLCCGDHEWRNCTKSSPVKCANCGGDHPANTSTCPTRLAAIRRRKLFVSGTAPPPVKHRDRGWASASKSSSKTAPATTSVEFPLLAPSTTYGDHSYAAIASLSNTPAPSRTEGQQLTRVQQLVNQQRRDIASMQEKHEAQLQALAVAEQRSQLQNEGAHRRTDLVPEFIANIHQKMSTINESLSVLFATLQSLASIVPPGEARCAVQTLASMGTPLLAITREFQMPYHG